MNILKQRIARIGIGIGLAATMALSAVVPALADDVGGSAAVTGGAMAITSLSASTAAFNVTINGSDQTPTVDVTVHLKDDRGTGAGWKLQVAATTFTTGGGTPKTFANSGTFSISDRANGVDGAGTYTDPSNSVSSPPIAVTTAATTPSAVSVFNAALDSGMGHFTVTPSMQVAIPANAFAGTYTSTITYTIATGP
jgi:hypothetical protein